VVLPLLLTCEEACTYDDFAALRRRWIDCYDGRFLPVDLGYVIDVGCLCLLCDGLDQVETQAVRDYLKAAKHTFALGRENLVLIASRPSATMVLQHWHEVVFLRLQPFSEADQEVYFGREGYKKARRLFEMSPNMACVPMLAYMVQSLIDQGEANGVTTRTELYGRYLDYTIRRHETNRAFSLQNRSARESILKALGLLAYRALMEEPPQIQRIDARLYDSLKQECGAAYEALPQFGLVNLVERGDESLNFTHRSYQEYLAARHAYTSDEVIRGILKESWKPKWDVVIRFMAGLKGESTIQNILVKRDDIIHSNLFLSG
jgi:hypothetical protein